MNTPTLIRLSGRDIPIRGGTAVALGRFDGVHLGHSAVIRKAVEFARESGLASVVWTPIGMERGAVLTDDAEKAELIASLGADFIAEQEFSAIRGQSGARFVSQTLFDALNVRRAFTGFNFTFGAGGRGGVTELDSLLKAGGASLEVTMGIELDGITVASTRIRELIESGEVEEAARMLGRPYEIRGIVSHGRRVGHSIGVPTANICPPPQKAVPRRGVYASTVSTRDRSFRGVSNIGVNPTVTNVGETRLETHLIDFDGDLYGQTITVKLLKFLRPERRFDSLDGLKAQIEADISAAASL